MIRIESRNADDIRLIHEFESREALLADLNSDDPSMGDNHILLVAEDGMVLFSSLGRRERSYADTVRTTDIVGWFSGGKEDF